MLQCFFLPFSLKPLSVLLQVHGLFFSQWLLHACIYLYIHILLKNNLLSPYNVVCILEVLFGTVQPIVVLFSGGIASPAPSFIQLPVVLCVGLRAHGAFLVHFGMLVVSSLFNSCLGDRVVRLYWYSSCCH